MDPKSRTNITISSIISNSLFCGHALNRPPSQICASGNSGIILCLTLGSFSGSHHHFSHFPYPVQRASGCISEEKLWPPQVRKFVRAPCGLTLPPKAMIISGSLLQSSFPSPQNPICFILSTFHFVIEPYLHHLYPLRAFFKLI